MARNFLSNETKCINCSKERERGHFKLFFKNYLYNTVSKTRKKKEFEKQIKMNHSLNETEKGKSAGK